MKRSGILLLLLTALVLVAMGAGCTTTHTRESARQNYYQRHGSVHNDSFPVDYVPGRYRGYGSWGGSWGRW
jgi:hypothetical protein